MCWKTWTASKSSASRATNAWVRSAPNGGMMRRPDLRKGSGTPQRPRPRAAAQEYRQGLRPARHGLMRRMRHASALLMGEGQVETIRLLSLPDKGLRRLWQVGSKRYNRRRGRRSHQNPATNQGPRHPDHRHAPRCLGRQTRSGQRDHPLRQTPDTRCRETGR